MSTPMTDASPSPAPRARAWKTFAVTALGIVMVLTNMTAIDVSLPSIARSLGASPSQSHWILLGYMLTLSLLVLPMGRLADLFDRKKLYLAGVGAFTAGSLVCGLATTAGVMIAGRLLQAVGAASIMSNNLALVADAFPARRLSLVLGMNATIAALASVSGPLVGGALVVWLGWRATFLLLVPLGLASLVAGTRVLRSTSGRDADLDLAGMVLVAVCLGALVYAISESGVGGWARMSVRIAAALLLVSAIAFAVQQRRARQPLFDAALFTPRTLVLAYVANFVVSAIQVSAILLLSLYLQATAGKNALAAGVSVMPFALGLMCSAFPAGWLMRRVAGDRLASLGVGLIVFGLGVLAWTVSQPASAALQPLAMGLLGIGTGLFTTPNTASILLHVAPSHRGLSNGLRSMTQHCGFVIGTAVSLAVVTAPLDAAARMAVYTGGHLALDLAQQQAMRRQYATAFVLLTVFALLGLACCLLRSRIHRRRTCRSAHS